MADERIEIFKTHRAAQEKYIYFLLAAAGAGIALIINQTHDSKLAWSMIPLGLAVLCWGLSFIFGCRHLNYVESILFANSDLLRVEAGMHPSMGMSRAHIAAVSEGIRTAIEESSNRAAVYARIQFRLLIAGALLFIAWHVTEMYLRATRDPIPNSTTWPNSSLEPVSLAPKGRCNVAISKRSRKDSQGVVSHPSDHVGELRFADPPCSLHAKTNRKCTPMNRLVRASLGLLAWSLLQASPASAQLKGNAENICRNGYFPRESTDYRLAKIKGAAGDKIHFHGDDNERCPDDAACRLKTYVIPGDEVIVSRTSWQVRM